MYEGLGIDRDQIYAILNAQLWVKITGTCLQVQVCLRVTRTTWNGNRDSYRYGCMPSRADQCNRWLLISAS